MAADEVLINEEVALTKECDLEGGEEVVEVRDD